MGITQIRKFCIEGQQQEQKPSHYAILADDFKRFQKERWYTYQNPILFDPNKFIFLYPNYDQEQEILLARWKATIDIKNIQYGQSRNEEDVLSTRWKYAIKRGVPIEYYKIIISVIFNKNFNNLKPYYDKLKNEINYNQSLPLFGLEQSSIKKAINAPFLNQKGYNTLKELMYLFKKKKGQFFYNRYIGHVTAIMLIFFQDYQAYELVSTMMNESSNMTINRAQSHRWHIVFKEEQMKNVAQTFYSIVSNNSETIAKLQKHFKSNSIDKIQLFTIPVDNFFYGFLPFSLILRVFILFLNEGVKMLFRVFYLMIAYAQKELLEANSLEKCLSVLKKKCLGITSSQSILILKNSFNLNLKATISTKLIESRLKKQLSQRKYYFLPFINGSSNILSFEDLELIWNFLPFELKTFDLELRYPKLDQEKLHLKDLLKSIQKQKFNLIIIKTVAGNVFGCFFIGSPQVEQSQSWYGNNQNYIFTIHPKPKKYTTTRQNNNFLFTGKDQFKVGFGGPGNAILLKQNLQFGETFKCFTFRNEPLNNEVQGQFQIQYVQSFTLY